MKKVIITIIISGIVFGSIGVLGATYLYHANEVSYTPSNSNFNVDNVDDAINNLYDKINAYTLENVWNIEFGYLYMGNNIAGYIPLLKSINSVSIRIINGPINVYGVSDDINHTEILLGTISKNSVLTFSNLKDYIYLKLQWVSGVSVGVYYTYLN